MKTREQQTPVKKTKILNTSAPSEQSKSKRIKMEDGTEIITLNFTTTEEQSEQVPVHPGENENESILGYDEAADRCDEGKKKLGPAIYLDIWSRKIWKLYEFPSRCTILYRPVLCSLIIIRLPFDSSYVKDVMRSN